MAPVRFGYGFGGGAVGPVLDFGSGGSSQTEERGGVVAVYQHSLSQRGGSGSGFCS